jgi:hypothetical protein
LTGDRLSQEERLEIRLVRDRVLVELADEAALLEHLETGGIAAVAAGIQFDGVRVLFAAEDQLGFAFALHRSAPHRVRGAEHDRHHAHPDEERGHRIAALAPCHGNLTRISVDVDAVRPSGIVTVSLTVC